MRDESLREKQPASNKIRVLHCLETVGSGGVEQRRLSLARQLGPDRYEQQLLCTKAIGGLPELFAQANCPLHEVGVFRGIFDRKPYLKAINIIKEFRPHIIHGAVYEGVALATICGRLGRVPVIIGEETSDPQNRSWKGSLLYRTLASLSDHMVGVSPAVKDYLTCGIRLPARKVSLINNGVQEKAPAQAEQIAFIREKFRFTPGDFIIGTVGRLFDEHKRVSDLIRAMPRIIEKYPKVRLLVVGTGPDETRLHELAAELSVAEHVFFAGYQMHTQPYYEVMDVFVMAPAYEAFGLVLVEAMYAGLPIVATRVGGIPGIVSEGKTGYLVEPYKPEDIADAVLRLAGAPEASKEMGRRGQARARSEFSAERYVADVDQLYQRLLPERTSG